MLGKSCHEINQRDRTMKDFATQNGRRRLQMTSLIAWVYSAVRAIQAK